MEYLKRNSELYVYPMERSPIVKGDVTLPADLSSLLSTMREEPGAIKALLIQGLLQGEVERTPNSWENRDPVKGYESVVHEYMLAIASEVGKPYPIETCQKGRMVQDLIPIKSHENQQYGTGSVYLELHTEDAFHLQAADYLCLFSMRNNDSVETLINIPDLDQLNSEDLNLLRQPNFQIKPDPSHLLTGDQKLESLSSQPVRAPLVGYHETPDTVRFDDAFLVEDDLSEREKHAVGALRKEIKSKLQPVILGPGDLLIFDNRRCIHGRKSYSPKYDGTDRWIKRCFIRGETNE